jgi:hypothetical protein
MTDVDCSRYYYYYYYYYYYIQVLRPYASLWAYNRRVSDETVYKSLNYIHKNARKKYIKGLLDVYTPDIYLFIHAAAYLISPIIFQTQ